MAKPKERSSSKKNSDLLPAFKKLEKDFILDKVKEAKLAKSGTAKYGFENIVGVGISQKMISNNFIGEKAITVFVVKKVSQQEIVKEALVPDKILGIKTDVLEIGEVKALAYVGRYRPAPGGVSVGHFQVTAGTLGCLVKKSGQAYILSNNHVIANSNNASVNDPILQPGPFDGGQVSTDRIGRLSEFVPIQFGNVPNVVDCAIAKATPSLVSAQNKCFGTISSSLIQPSLFLIVKKCGRSTELTYGLVIAVNVTIRVGYGSSGTAIFQNQFMVAGVPFIAPFSQPGDSGSLVATAFGNKPVGLLFAGSSLVTLANPISAVLSSLNVSVQN